MKTPKRGRSGHSGLALDLPQELSRMARYLVGVSGGRDSVALLHALWEAGFRRLVICHLNHGLRGRAAAADARFVSALGKKLGLEVVVEKVDVAAFAEDRRVSLETAARSVRHMFFAHVARERRCRTLFLAHHADDQVETFLLNLCRGAGKPGLGAMRPQSKQEILLGEEKPVAVKLQILRPLLSVWRAEIDLWLRARRHRYREDESNASAAFTRNRIRRTLIPVLKEVFDRDVRPALWRATALLRDEEMWISELIADAIPERLPHLSLDYLAVGPPAVQRRQILAWLRCNGVPDAGFKEVERVRSLFYGGVTRKTPAKVNLPGNWHARRRAGRLFLERGQKAPEKVSAKVSKKQKAQGV